MNIFPDSYVHELLFHPVRLLLSSECDLEEVDGFGRSALLASIEGVKRSHLAEMVDLLLLSEQIRMQSIMEMLAYCTIFFVQPTPATELILSKRSSNLSKT